MVILLEKHFCWKSLYLICLTCCAAAIYTCEPVYGSLYAERGLRGRVCDNINICHKPDPSTLFHCEHQSGEVCSSSSLTSDKATKTFVTRSMLSGDRQKLEVLFHEDFSAAQTN